MTGHQATVQTYVEGGAIVIAAESRAGTRARITLDPQVALLLADQLTIMAHAKEAREGLQCTT